MARWFGATFNHRVAGSSPARLTTLSIEKQNTYDKARFHVLNMCPSFGTRKNADDLQASPEQWIRPRKEQAVPPISRRAGSTDGARVRSGSRAPSRAIQSERVWI